MIVESNILGTTKNVDRYVRVRLVLMHQNGYGVNNIRLKSFKVKGVDSFAVQF